MQLPSEHNGAGIGGFECRSVCHQPQRSFREELILPLEAIPGQKAIADDILVVGVEEKEALEDHDRNLREVFNRCRQKGIKLNPEKMQFR